MVTRGLPIIPASWRHCRLAPSNAHSYLIHPKYASQASLPQQIRVPPNLPSWIVFISAIKEVHTCHLTPHTPSIAAEITTDNRHTKVQSFLVVALFTTRRLSKSVSKGYSKSTLKGYYALHLQIWFQGLLKLFLKATTI